MLGALDKLNVQPDTITPLRREFLEFIEPIERAVKAGEKKLPHGWHSDEHFHAIGRLEEFGIDGMFHGWLKHKRNDGRQTHKVELWNVGETGRSRLYADLERIVANDPGDLPTMRIDCCADMVGTPTTFVRLHMRVARKRRGAEIREELPERYEHIFGVGDTFYFGSRNNCVRSYDKTAELKVQFKKKIRKFARESKAILGVDRDGGVLRPEVYSGELPTFEQTYGISEDAVITRVERVINGCDDVPANLATLRQLDNLVDFDPFENVIIYAAENSTYPQWGDHHEYTFAQFQCGEHLRSLQRALGLEYVRQYIRKHCPGNYRREFATYEPFLKPLLPGEKGFTRDELFETYRASIRRQLAA